MLYLPRALDALEGVMVYPRKKSPCWKSFLRKTCQQTELPIETTSLRRMSHVGARGADTRPGAGRGTTGRGDGINTAYAQDANADSTVMLQAIADPTECRLLARCGQK